MGSYLTKKYRHTCCFTMLYYINAENVEISINTHLLQQNIQKINRRTLKYILRLKSFCQNRLIDQDNAIKIALYLSDYYYLIRVYEHMHREGKRVDSILCSLYFLVSDYEKCKALNMQVKLISTVNVFFDLCLENEFDSARSCLANIYSDEIESALFNKMLEKIESESNDIEEVYKLSSDIRKQYSTWNSMDNETRNINMHIAYDIDLMTKNDLTTETLELIAMRHEISQHRSHITAKHLSLIDFMPYKQECAKLMKSKCFKEYCDYFTFDKIADMRKTGDLIQCKSKITSLLLDKNYDALYEYAKYKEHTGQTIDAIQTLEKLLYMSNGEGTIHKKSMLLHAQLSQDQKTFVNAFDRYKTSETLFFQYGKYLEKLDPLASLEAYLKSLLYGTKYINESLLKILNLLCETKDEKYPKKSYKTMAEFYKKAGILAETYFSQINVNDYKYFIGQILSKLGHANKKINDVIVALVRNIIIADSFAISGWYIMFTFDKEAKDLHTEMIEILKSLPSEMHIKLKEFKALIEMLISISKFDAKGNKNIKIDETLKLNRKINFNIRVPNESWETYLQEINNDIYVYHSLQCPKRIAMLGSNGKTYYFLCKSNDDLRKDARFMDLSRVMNIVLNNSRYTNNDNLYIRTYNIFVLRYSCGIIEWVPGLETLRNIIYPEYAKINLNVNDELKKHRTKKKVGDKSFQDVLKRFPPVLRNYFDSIIDPKTSYMARDKFTKTYAVMCVVGWFMGLGDRHLENIMIDVSTSDTFHVDLNCILNKAKKLEIPESVPFRLTQNIVDAFGVLKTEATFKSAMVKTLKTMIDNEELIMTTLQCIINDPFSEWKAKSKASLENINKALDEFRNKLRCDPDKMVDHLIDEAKDIHSLANMYIGWCSFV